MQVTRCSYLVGTNLPKNNGEKLTDKDLINVGYMAGRFGISLDGDLSKNMKPQVCENGTYVNINSCTQSLFEKELNNAGIKFMAIA